MLALLLLTHPHVHYDDGDGRPVMETSCAPVIGASDEHHLPAVALAVGLVGLAPAAARALERVPEVGPRSPENWQDLP